MPTYVYGCDGCGQQFEKFQKFSDEPIRECPQCHSRVRRIVQPAGIVFKGSGWHITDYKRSGGNGKTDNNGSESKSDSDGNGKAESKPAEAKSESTTGTTSETAKPASTS